MGIRLRVDGQPVQEREAGEPGLALKMDDPNILGHQLCVEAL